MNNRFNINEEEKNRIRGLHGMQVINEQTKTGDQVASEYEGATLTPAVQNHVGKTVTSLKMLQIMAGCWTNNVKSGELWAGLEPGGYGTHSARPIIYPGDTEGTVVGATKSWSGSLNPCKLSQIKGDMWTRSDFLVPGIVNFWTKMAREKMGHGISNTPANQYNDDGDELYSDKQIQTMEALGDSYTWVPGRNLSHNTMWTLTKV